MGAQLVLDRLTGVKARGPGRWVAKCPAHKAETPALSVCETPDGRVVLHDFGGCSVDEVLSAIGVVALANDYKPTSPRGAHAHASGDLLHVMLVEVLAVRAIADFLRDGATLSDVAYHRLERASERLREAVRVGTKLPVP